MLFFFRVVVHFALTQKMSLSGVDRSYWAIKNIYMPLPSSYAIGRQCWKAYLVFGSRCKYAAKIIHSFLSDSHSCLWKNCTKGSEKKEMFVRASAKAGGCVCVCGGWVGWGLTQTVQKRDIARQTQSQIQHNWTLFSVSGLSGLQVSPCNNKWFLLCNSQSATQAGWLAGGAASSLSACLPCSNLSRRASRYFQTMPISTSPWFRVGLLSTLFKKKCYAIRDIIASCWETRVSQQPKCTLNSSSIWNPLKTPTC